MTIKEYYEHPALNQSKLKKLLGYNPKEFITDENIESSGFTIGSAVDCLLTRPEDFEKEYYVPQIEKNPSQSIISIWEHYYSIKGECYEIDKNLLLAIAKKEEYRQNWKENTIIDNLIKEGKEYYDSLVTKGDRKILIKEKYSIAIKMAQYIKLCFPKIFNDISMQFQVPIFGKIKNREIKGLVDMMKIDDKTKTIEIYDIKTTYLPTIKFIDELHKYRYDIQMAWYKEIISQKYPEYKIVCSFIVESTSEPGTPLMYICDKRLLEMGKYGATRTNYEMQINGNVINDSYYIEGFMSLLEKLDFYEKNGFDTDIRIRNNNHIVSIDWYGSKELKRI